MIRRWLSWALAALVAAGTFALMVAREVRLLRKVADMRKTDKRHGRMNNAKTGDNLSHDERAEQLRRLARDLDR